MINAGNHEMTTFETFVLLFGHRKSGEREFHVCIYKCQDKIHGGMILTASGVVQQTRSKKARSREELNEDIENPSNLIYD